MALISKKSLTFVVVFAAIVAAGVVLYLYYPMAPSHTPQSISTSTTTPTITEVQIGTTTINVEVESTDASREQGLSGRTSLAPGNGMLFVFQQDGDWGFWMKDMNFPIDIIFISATQTPNVGAVVSVAANASPAGYLENPPQVFYPPLAVRYVLEVPAGFALAHNIVGGSVFQFK